MASWNEITAAVPDLAATVEGSFAANLHKVMATVRADGSPRLSGTEVDITLGEMWIGSMPGARKARDLQRDPRLAIHSAPLDMTLKVPDCRVAGRAVEITDAQEIDRWRRASGKDESVPEEPFHLFRLDLDEVACTTVIDDVLVVEWWRPASGRRRVERT